MSNMAGVLLESGTTYLIRAPGFDSGFWLVPVAHLCSFCVVLLFLVLFLFVLCLFSQFCHFLWIYQSSLPLFCNVCLYSQLYLVQVVESTIYIIYKFYKQLKSQTAIFTCFMPERTRHIIVEGEFRSRTSEKYNQNMCVPMQELTFHRHMPWSSSY